MARYLSIKSARSQVLPLRAAGRTHQRSQL